MHKNNFDFLRLVFALTVVVTHSYALICNVELDFLGYWTDSQVVLSYLGVRGFFVLSGYLIFQSMLRSEGILDFFWKRALRLWPGLLTVLALTILVAPLVYDGSDGPYWFKRDVWTYLPRNASLYALQPDIKGVFTHNPFTPSVNGSLWTICHEFTCYMLVGFLLFLRKWPLLMKGILVGAWVAALVCATFFGDFFIRHYFFLNIGIFIELSVFFLGGSLLAAFGFERMPFKGWIALASSILLVLLLALGQFKAGFHFFLFPLLVLSIGLQATRGLSTIGDRIGDLSYGIYIYAFPVQQAIEHFLQPEQPLMLVLSTPIIVGLAWLSWHLVEKRALSLKRWNPSRWLSQQLGKA